MKTTTWTLAAMMALSAGLGMSVSTNTAAADHRCIKWCRADYTSCWHACTPGQDWCYDMCSTDYFDCVDGC